MTFMFLDRSVTRFLHGFHLTNRSWSRPTRFMGLFHRVTLPLLLLQCRSHLHVGSTPLRESSTLFPDMRSLCFLCVFGADGGLQQLHLTQQTAFIYSFKVICGGAIKELHLNTKIWSSLFIGCDQRIGEICCIVQFYTKN